MANKAQLAQLEEQIRCVIVEELHLTGPALFNAYEKEDELQEQIDELRNWLYGGTDNYRQLEFNFYGG